MHAFAMIQPYGPPDWERLEASSNTAYFCELEETYQVVPLKRILAVVAAIPDVGVGGHLSTLGGRVFIVEKMGLDVMPFMEGLVEVDEEGDVIMSDT